MKMAKTDLTPRQIYVLKNMIKYDKDIMVKGSGPFQFTDGNGKWELGNGGFLSPFFDKDGKYIDGGVLDNTKGEKFSGHIMVRNDVLLGLLNKGYLKQVKKPSTDISMKSVVFRINKDKIDKATLKIL